MFWKLLTGRPNAVREVTYSTVSHSTRSTAATAPTAMDSRSCGSFSIRCRKPEFSPPSRFLAGTRTSSKNSSAVSCALRPTFSRLRPRENPGMPRSTTSRLSPLAPGACGSVLATTITRSALMPLLMNVFDPPRTQPSPFLRAVVEMPCRSLPAPGSIIAIAVMSSPLQKPGSQRCFCSSVARSRR